MLNKTGRPTKGHEKLTERIPVYFPKSTAERLKGMRGDASEFIREATELQFQKDSNEPAAETFDAIHILGYIHAGDAMAICPMPAQTRAYPPFAVSSECYALHVVGSSMTAEYGTSIPSGSYAIFCPDIMPAFGTLVHVEWEELGEHVCTLKKYCPQADGSAIFEPLNKKHKPIKRKANEFVIKGVFRRAWKDSDELQ